MDELAAPGGRGVAEVAVGSPGLPGLSTPHSSLKGWKVPAFPPGPHTKLPWGRQAFNPPSAEEGKGGTGMLAVYGGRDPPGEPRGGEGKHLCSCDAEAVFVFPGGPDSAGRGCSGRVIRGRAMSLPSYGQER